MSDAASVAAPHEPALDLHLRVETPEDVVLSYRLAGPALRLWAYLIDLFVRIGLCIGTMMLLSCSGVLALLPGTSMGIYLVLVFFAEWFYYVVAEGFFRGKTIGKQIFRLRVIHEEGYPITFWAAMLRNIVRAADVLAFYGVALLTMIVAGKFQRLGDLAARTIVIEERHIRLPLDPLILEKIAPLARGEIGSFVPSDQTLALIEQFHGRRSALTYERGHEMALVLARVLADRLRYTGDRKLVEEYPMGFLARVYATFYQPPQPMVEKLERGPRRELEAVGSADA
ncbi:MAG TPA: RDD family protein [Planctomycetaceae bacterium]|nr:RDD family protein [Planctomycetaceae bacterium]